LRIISGTHRGRQLHPPKGLTVRPTTDLAKESLFNILVNRVDFEDIAVLDLFAGTGNISFEFASRGARDVVSVELNHRCTDFISRCVHAIGFERVFVVKANVFNYLKSVKRKFDVIFADPPYEMREVQLIPDLVFNHGLLNDEGWLIVEHDSSVVFKEHPAFIDERQYGRVHFSFFQFPAEAS
jgi:16S rRNA (guanine966-N2)-methyltransferase